MVSKSTISNNTSSTQITNDIKKNTTIKKKHNRCAICNKKIPMIHFTCKCNLIFCIKHQLPHTHNCTYNYKKDLKKEIIINNPKIKSKMVNVI